MKWHGLRGLDACGHALISVLRVPFPLWLYRICCAVEREHDRRWPEVCSCCTRRPFIR